MMPTLLVPDIPDTCKVAECLMLLVLHKSKPAVFFAVLR
jgi:hypothetical protein